MKNQSTHKFGRKSERGSALITAVIFSFIIGAFAVTFLKLANNEYRAAVRSTLYASTLNLAESGVEIALQQLIDDKVTGSTSATLTSSKYLVDESYEGDIKMVILDPQSLNPIIYSEGTISGHPSGDVVKQVRVTTTSGFYPFSNGFSARNGITFVGNNVILDSFNSEYGAYNVVDSSTVPADYGVAGAYTNRNDNLVASSLNINTESDDSISVGNATITGNANVEEGETISIGAQGDIIDIYGNQQTTRDDFYADFPIVDSDATPSTSLGNVRNYTVIVGSTSKDAPLVADSTDVSLSGNGKDMVVIGHVELQMSGDFDVSTGVYLAEGLSSLPADVASGLSAAQQALVTSHAATGTSMTIYSAHDVKISGNGVTNPSGLSENFRVMGTAADATDRRGDYVSSQEIKIAGNGVLYSSVYAPNADVELKGGGNAGEVMGAVVAFTATLNGNSNFHFDEALAKELWGDGGYTITSWLEMTGITTNSKPLDLSAY